MNENGPLRLHVGILDLWFVWLFSRNLEVWPCWGRGGPRKGFEVSEALCYSQLASSLCLRLMDQDASSALHVAFAQL